MHDAPAFAHGMYRGGVALGPERWSPCYFPQYDTIWCPVSFSEDCDNQPKLGSSDESRLEYLCSFEHEMGHRMINMRTIVGLIHVTFTVLKIVRLFHWYPTATDRQLQVERLHRIYRQSRAFFQSTSVWDETFSVLYTRQMADMMRLDIADLYMLRALEQYPSIRQPCEDIDFVLNNVNGPIEARSLLIRSVFDAAAAIDIHAILSSDGEHLQSQHNVDERFLAMIAFCARALKDDSSLDVECLAGLLIAHLDERDIRRHEQYDEGELLDDFEQVDELYVDGLLFHLMYMTIVRRLLKDMTSLRLPIEEVADAGYPLSPVTLRPLPPHDCVMGVVRSGDFVADDTFELPVMNMTVHINIGICFLALTLLGVTVDMLVEERSSGTRRAPPNFTMCDFRRIFESLRPTMNGTADPEVVNSALAALAANVVRKVDRY